MDFDALHREFLIDLNGDGKPDAVVRGAGLPDYGLGPMTPASRSGRPNAELRQGPPTTGERAVNALFDYGAMPARGATHAITGALDLAALPGDLLTGAKRPAGDPGSRESMAAMTPAATDFALLTVGGTPGGTPAGALGSGGVRPASMLRQMADNPKTWVPAGAIAGGLAGAAFEVGRDSEPTAGSMGMAPMMAAGGAALYGTPAAAKAVGRHIIAPAAAGLGRMVEAGIARGRAWMDEVAPSSFGLGDRVGHVNPEVEVARDRWREEARARWQAGSEAFGRDYANRLATEAAQPLLEHLPMADQITVGRPVSRIETGPMLQGQWQHVGTPGSRSYVRRANNPEAIESYQAGVARDEVRRDAKYGRMDAERQRQRLSDALPEQMAAEMPRAVLRAEMAGAGRDAMATAPARYLNALSERTGVSTNALIRAMEESGYDLSHLTRDKFLSRSRGAVTGAEPDGMTMFDQVRSSPILYRGRMPNALYDHTIDYSQSMPKGRAASIDDVLADAPPRAPRNVLVDDLGGGGNLPTRPTSTHQAPEPPPSAPIQQRPAGPTRAQGGLPYEGFSSDMVRALESINPRTARDLIADPQKAEAQIRSIARQLTNVERGSDVPEQHMRAAREIFEAWKQVHFGGGA